MPISTRHLERAYNNACRSLAVRGDLPWNW